MALIEAELGSALYAAVKRKANNTKKGLFCIRYETNHRNFLKHLIIKRFCLMTTKNK